MINWIKSKIKQRGCSHNKANIWTTKVVKEVDGEFVVYRIKMICSDCDKKIDEFWETGYRSK